MTEKIAMSYSTKSSFFIKFDTTNWLIDLFQMYNSLFMYHKLGQLIAVDFNILGLHSIFIPFRHILALFYVTKYYYFSKLFIMRLKCWHLPWWMLTELGRTHAWVRVHKARVWVQVRVHRVQVRVRVRVHRAWVWVRVHRASTIESESESGLAPTLLLISKRFNRFNWNLKRRFLGWWSIIWINISTLRDQTRHL